MSNTRNTGELIRILERLGWIWVSQNKHHKMKWKDGSVLTFSGSPTCPYAYKHVIKDAKKIMSRSQQGEESNESRESV